MERITKQNNFSSSKNTENVEALKDIYRSFKNVADITDFATEESVLEITDFKGNNSQKAAKSADINNIITAYNDLCEDFDKFKGLIDAHCEISESLKEAIKDAVIEIDSTEKQSTRSEIIKEYVDRVREFCRVFENDEVVSVFSKFLAEAQKDSKGQKLRLGSVKSHSNFLKESLRSLRYQQTIADEFFKDLVEFIDLLPTSSSQIQDKTYGVLTDSFTGTLSRFLCIAVHDDNSRDTRSLTRMRNLESVLEDQNRLNDLLEIFKTFIIKTQHKIEEIKRRQENEIGQKQETKEVIFLRENSSIYTDSEEFVKLCEKLLGFMNNSEALKVLEKLTSEMKYVHNSLLSSCFYTSFIDNRLSDLRENSNLTQNSMFLRTADRQRDFLKNSITDSNLSDAERALYTETMQQADDFSVRLFENLNKIVRASAWFLLIASGCNEEKIQEKDEKETKATHLFRETLNSFLRNVEYNISTSIVSALFGRNADESKNNYVERSFRKALVSARNGNERVSSLAQLSVKPLIDEKFLNVTRSLHDMKNSAEKFTERLSDEKLIEKYRKKVEERFRDIPELPQSSNDAREAFLREGFDSAIQRNQSSLSQTFDSIIDEVSSSSKSTDRKSRKRSLL